MENTKNKTMIEIKVDGVTLYYQKFISLPYDECDYKKESLYLECKSIIFYDKYLFLLFNKSILKNIEKLLIPRCDIDFIEFGYYSSEELENEDKARKARDEDSYEGPDTYTCIHLNNIDDLEFFDDCIKYTFEENIYETVVSKDRKYYITQKYL
jgi:hypothetical protein